MPRFVRLADPGYTVCQWNLHEQQAHVEYWTEFVRGQIAVMLKAGIEAQIAHGMDPEDVRARAEACRAQVHAECADVDAHPMKHAPVTIFTLDLLRDRILRKHGFPDPYVDLKAKENAKMLPLLPTVCAQLDALQGQEQLRAVIEGVFAGNIFDMGMANIAAAMMSNVGPEFFATRDKLARRPWLIDHYDALSKRMLDGPVHRKAIYFIDNAGSDFLLGVLPMIRWLAKRGTRVVIAANELPSLNDMTIGDLNTWWPRILEAEPSIRNLPIERVSSGTGEPLVNLAEISEALNAQAKDADLVILEGMGRGVESNLKVKFDCDNISLAMVKDTFVAEMLGGKAYDVVCRFSNGFK